MRHTDTQTLITRARKAGLRATEIYSALNSRLSVRGPSSHGLSDTNGYAARYNQDGQCEHLPLEAPDDLKPE